MSGEGAGYAAARRDQPRRALVRRGLGRSSSTASAFQHAATRCRCRSGTGSSSAAIVAGLAAALALQGRPHGTRRADRAGGADRGAPRQRGRGDRRRASRSRSTASAPLLRRIEPPAGPRVRARACPTTSSAPRSRASRLRPDVPRADAVYSLQRTALLVLALATGDLDALPARARRPPAPARPRRADAACSAASRSTCPALGAYGCTLSGAGPEHAPVGARRAGRARSPRASRRSLPDATVTAARAGAAAACSSASRRRLKSASATRRPSTAVSRSR